MRSSLIKIASKLHPVFIVVLILALNYYWVALLNSFEIYFKSLEQKEVVDLLLVKLFSSNNYFSDNSQTILSIIQSYGNESRIAYWVFFILDNFMPLVVFGSFSLIWVRILKFIKWQPYQWLLNTSFILIPFGVGLVDIFENLFFIQVVSDPTNINAKNLIDIALFLNTIKAMFLLGTFFITLCLIISLLAYLLVQRLPKNKSSATN